jgi:hypothetical protein
LENCDKPPENFDAACWGLKFGDTLRHLKEAFEVICNFLSKIHVIFQRWTRIKALDTGFESLPPVHVQYSEKIQKIKDFTQMPSGISYRTSPKNR